MAVNQATIAGRYAKALFELTHDSDLDQATLAELTALQAVFQDNPELTKAIDSERISEQGKIDLLNVMKQSASQLVQNLLQMTFDYRRFDLLPDIITDYEKLVNKAAGKLKVSVTTAIAMSDEQVDKFKTQLMQRFAAKEIELSQTVDESIIGGVITYADNQILDGSLATKLAAIRQSIIR
ncbi:F0F1 ATP synthase subunit delta [Weissella oryzae SG25]|uniref:ATP synthase subunit delta n=1 Tax=Weissella oryzae (strain DSM 25784 / JCM 18191 / LMG 30913 / SG25) TaxID=1329250 RepID=A0A069CRN0_WEIOS|nr:ATP synthase F1 subunit delta [Weissella oryzae]GAK30027.1 F0F1 ATP synthase subunit delta [Weissella oryzae SG25]